MKKSQIRQATLNAAQMLPGIKFYIAESENDNKDLFVMEDSYQEAVEAADSVGTGKYEVKEVTIEEFITRRENQGAAGIACE